MRKENRKLTYEQFIIATFSFNGDVEEFFRIIDNNKFQDYEAVYKFIKKNYKIRTKFETLTYDYPDVIRRILIISGFITIRYEGKKLIEINENKLDYIREIVKTDFKLTEKEKAKADLYFKKFEAYNDLYLKIVYKYRAQDRINGEIYKNKIFNIIDNYNINEDIIVESIKKIGSRKTVIDEFKEIPEPLKLEFFISILIALKYGKQFAIRPNYKADHIGKPYSHAPGNKGDIEIFSNDIYWLIEVTLIKNKTQQLNNETTTIIRHLDSNEEFANYLRKYLSFVAPIIHIDVKEFFDYSIVKRKSKKYEIKLKPYTINEFVNVTLKRKNFEDMDNYTKKVVDEFRKKLEIT